MKKEILKRKMGDMYAKYDLDTETGVLGLCLLPEDRDSDASRRVKIMPLIEAKIIGDRYSGNYFGGESMKYSDTTFSFRYDKQTVTEGNGAAVIETHLKTTDGIKAVHTLMHKKGRKYLTAGTKIINNSQKDIRLEMLSSFALYNISPYLEGAGENSMRLHRLRSKWSMEGRLISEPLEELMLEECWCYANSKSVRFGSIGSMPSKAYFPFAALEDIPNGIIWGARMSAPSSWQMEITRADDGVCVSGGIADREFGHWTKTVRTGESFRGPEAFISVCCGDADDISQRLLEATYDALSVPECEEELPVIFNEYCTTWGCPSHDNIAAALNAIEGKGIDYFVIDCGWFKEDGVRWDISMGDYIPSKTLFPNGIKATAQLIKSYNMRPGIWFEIENVGIRSRAYYEEEHLLKRDGITLTTQSRRFWDMNDEWTKKYLQKRVIDFIKDNGFGYIKIDYNDTIGIGCDNIDSLGEGLRQNIAASTEFFSKIREEIPDCVIENCASGGGRLEHTFMSLSSMSSFSDAHECVEIPLIAANLHRAVLPRQSQIWCVIRKDDGAKRIAYSVAASFLGRMCLSGDVAELTRMQWDVIERGIAFYKKIVPVIKNGTSKIYQNGVKSFRHPEGYQAVLRKNDNMAVCVIHTFRNAPLIVSVPVGDCEITDTYSDENVDAHITDGILYVRTDSQLCGYGIAMKKAAGRKMF